MTRWLHGMVAIMNRNWPGAGSTRTASTGEDKDFTRAASQSLLREPHGPARHRFSRCIA
jgi:hypothetical protein